MGPRILQLWRLLILIFLAAGFGACEDEGEPGPGIVPGVGVEGARLGTSFQEVKAILGAATGEGLACGLGSWWAYRYERGDCAGLHFYFVDQSPSSEPGALDIITLQAPYAGKTREGIGLGCTRAQVVAAFGPAHPSSSPPSDPNGTDFYCCGRTPMEISYSNGIITSMSIGPFFVATGNSATLCNK